MKLSSTQLFIIMLVSLAILAGAAFLDRTYLPVLVGVLIGAINIFTHINGVQTGVPLSSTLPLAPLSALPALEEVRPAPAAPLQAKEAAG